MFNLFVDHFNAVQTFNSVLPLSVSAFCFRDRASFYAFDGCYLFTIVHCHSASSASRVRAVFVNKKQKPQLSQVFLQLELVLLSSSRNCGMRAAQCHQLSHTYQLGQCFYIQFSPWSCETFDKESKANPKYFHR